MDPLSGMGSLNLGGTATSHTQSMQGFPTSLSSAFSNPQSPAKAFPPLSTPNPSTPFGGIGSLSSQLPGMDSGTKLFLLFHFDTHKQARHRFILSIVRWTMLRRWIIVAQRVRWHALKWLCFISCRSLGLWHRLRYWLWSWNANSQHRPFWHQEDEHTRPEPTYLSAE